MSEQDRMPPKSYTAAEIAAMEFANPDPILFYFERGKTSDIVAKPKDGKTTFILEGIRPMRCGELFLGLPTKAVPVLYLTEQTKRSFRDKLRTAGITDGDDFRVFYITDFVGWHWPEICECVREECRCYEIGLLVVDTLSKWAKITDEDSAAEALRVVGPLQVIADDNVAVVTLRHAGKGRHNTQDVVDVGRGSSAFPGEFDVCTVLSRASGQGHPNRRELRSVAREDNVPPTLVIELKDGRYVCEGSTANVEYRAARAAWLEHLPSDKLSALPSRELCRIANNAFSERTAGRAIDDLCKEGVAAGKKGVGRAKRRDQDAYWLLDAEQRLDDDDDL